MNATGTRKDVKQMGRKTITNEDIITCLLSSDSISSASVLLGCNRRTLYRRMKDTTFQKQYKEAKTELLKNATVNLQKSASEAVTTMVSVMKNEDTPAQTKIYCATSILQYVLKFTEVTDILERIEALEEERKDDDTL